MLYMLAAIMAQVPIVAHPEDRAKPFHLSLICRGVAEKPVTKLSIGSVFGHHGGGATAVGTTSDLDQFGEEMDVEIDGDTGRVRPPRRLLSWIAKDHHSGWLDLKEVVVSDDAVEGKAVLTWALRPKLRIDRRSGSIAYDGGTGSFAGQCHNFDALKDQRAF